MKGLALLAILAVLPLRAVGYSNGMPSAGCSTGQPGGIGSTSHGTKGEGNGGYALTITGLSTDGSYTGGETYTVELSNTGDTSFVGFSVLPRTSAGGDFTSCSTSGCKTSSTCVNSGSGNGDMLTHSSSGSIAKAEGTWQAPAAGTGAVEFQVSVLKTKSSSSGVYYIFTETVAEMQPAPTCDAFACGSATELVAGADAIECETGCQDVCCQDILCPADVSPCLDGSSVSRDPSNGCAFPACPTITCSSASVGCDAGTEKDSPAKDSTVCTDPSADCKSTCCTDVVCTEDAKECGDGSFVSRDPFDGCTFPACPVPTCDSHVAECTAAGKQSVDGATTCDSCRGCTEDVCCRAFPTCASYVCSGATTAFEGFGVLATVCTSGSCDDATCCKGTTGAASSEHTDETCSALTCDAAADIADFSAVSETVVRRRGNRVITGTTYRQCDEIFGYNWFDIAGICDAETGKRVTPPSQIAQLATDNVDHVWTKEFDGSQTFKWGRSSVVDHAEGVAYVQFSREGMFGGQYGPTTKRGSLRKIDLKTGETLAELAGEGGENRWAPFIHGDYVYTVLSHYLHHADYNFIGGAGDTGRVGHWLYKLDKATLAIVQKREVSCDMGLFEEPAAHAKCSTVADFGDTSEVAKYLADVQGTTQLNGILAAAPLRGEDGATADDDRCGKGEARMIVGVSGYPYYYGFSDEPQNRALGLHNFHHTGKLAAFCTGSLLPAWRDPYRNGAGVPNEAFDESRWASVGGTTTQRDLAVGDTIAPAYKKEHNAYIGVLKQMDCSSMPTNTAKLLPKEYVLAIPGTDFDSLAWSYTPGDMLYADPATHGEGPAFKVVSADKSGIDGSLVLTVAPAKATHSQWNKGSVLSFSATEETNPVTVGSVETLVMETCYVTSSSLSSVIFQAKVFNSVECITWDVVPENGMLGENAGGAQIAVPQVDGGAVCDYQATMGEGITTVAPPTIKVLVEVGDTVEDEDMRISLGNFGGSVWFRVATDGRQVCTPTGNGAGMSMDKFLQTIDIQRAMVANDQAVAAALDAYLAAVDNASGVDAAYAAYSTMLDVRESLAKEKEVYRSKLSDADAASADCAIHCASLDDGARAGVTAVTGPDNWLVDSALNSGAVTHFFKTSEYDDISNALGQYGYVDADANNVLMIPDPTTGKAELLVGSTKGGAVFTISADTNTILHLHAVGRQPTSALGTDAAMNFGGMCYPGSGDIVVVATTAALADSGDFLILLGNGETELMKAGSSALVGYNFRTGKNEWATLRYSDRAVGVECGRGMAFALDPRKEKVQAVDAATGVVKFEVPAVGCEKEYNCGEVMLHGTSLYVSTNAGFSKYDFAAAGSNNGVFDLDTECSTRQSCSSCTENDAIGCKWSAGACSSACTSDVDCSEGAGTCVLTDWCPGVASYDWYSAAKEHPADAFLLELNKGGVGVAGLWIANAFFAQHPGGSFPLLSLDQVSLDETDTTCAELVGVLPLCGAPDGTTDVVGAQAHHGRAHRNDDGFKPTFVAMVEKHLVGYSYSTEDYNPCMVGNPILWFDTDANGCF